MYNRQQKHSEERIDFVTKHYREGHLDADEAWKRFASDLDIHPSIPLRRYGWVAAASVILLLVGLGSFFQWKSTAPEWVIVSTASGQLKEVYLPDSTLVSLAGESQIRYEKKAYGKQRREVAMSGKAFFRVTPDASRPFVVQTGVAETEVLGTDFQIARQATAIQVNVVTGKVSFRAGEIEKKIILTAGMSANYSMGTQNISVLTTDNSNFLSWKTGVLRFDNTPLEQVIEDLSNHYQIPVRSKSMIRGEKLTATFDGLPLEEVLLVIYQTLDVRLIAGKNVERESGQPG
ncbi:MAG: FecR domain-containing protein [Tannerella sp.]|jgi:ferric-dicitrate binding protein FerR (iron transport regulator)|nr:FecR domain-containing protein [Tannerella sp.]